MAAPIARRRISPAATPNSAPAKSPASAAPQPPAAPCSGGRADHRAQRQHRRRGAAHLSARHPAHRHRSGGQARARGTGAPAHRRRRRNHRRAEAPAQSRRAEAARHPVARRHAGPGADRAAPGRRDRYRHHGQWPEARLCRAQGQARADRRQFPRQPACDERRDPDRHRKSAAASTNPRRSSTRASPTAAASTSSCRPWPSTGRRSRSANFPRSRSPSTSWRASSTSRRQMGAVLEDRRPLAPQHPDFGRHRLGQDDAVERHCRR